MGCTQTTRKECGICQVRIGQVMLVYSRLGQIVLRKPMDFFVLKHQHRKEYRIGQVKIRQVMLVGLEETNSPSVFKLPGLKEMRGQIRLGRDKILSQVRLGQDRLGQVVLRKPNQESFYISQKSVFCSSTEVCQKNQIQNVKKLNIFVFISNVLSNIRPN